MQTTLRIEKSVAKRLEELKEKEHAKSYNEVIKRLLEKRELSMFGTVPKLKKWNEREDRARFRTDSA